jgi:hypothetical protein
MIAVYISLIVSLFLSIANIKLLCLAVTSKHWPLIQGVVVKSEYVETLDSEGKGHSAEIIYSYKIADEIFTSKKIAFFPSYWAITKSMVYKVLNRYPIGKKVNVYYSPENPAKSVLEPGVNAAGILITIFFLGVFCLLVFIVASGGGQPASAPCSGPDACDHAIPPHRTGNAEEQEGQEESERK